MQDNVIIIGGGLAGLTAAYKLQQQGMDPLLLEASDRLGGRIYTKTFGDQSFELGATWVFQDPLLKELILDLGLELYPQYLSGDALINYGPNMPIQKSPTAALMNGAMYHKIKGGTDAIIEALSRRLDSRRILLRKAVRALDNHQDHITVTTGDGSEMTASRVIVAVPPNVIARKIKISRHTVNEQVMLQTHTWMGESTKFTVLLDRDYWRLKNLSGFVFSNHGLIREMQDHSSDDRSTFGLVGFMQPTGLLMMDYEKRKVRVAQELHALFGIEEAHIIGYDDYLWGAYYADESSGNYNANLLPHQNNGHQMYAKPHFGGRLFFAGAETSSSNPGYMEGAVGSAYRAVRLLTTA